MRQDYLILLDGLGRREEGTEELDLDELENLR
jgi:hypothetical protein